MRRKKKPVNLWPLLALPIIGIAGWVLRRVAGRRNAPVRSIIPISGPKTGVETGRVSSNYAREKAAVLAQETKQKVTHQETTFTSSERRETEDEAVDAARQAAHPMASDTASPEAGARAFYPGHALESRPEKFGTLLLLLLPFLVLAVAIVLLAFRHIPVQSATIINGGDAKRGQVALQAWGCGACHTIPGVTGATGKVGPFLDGLTNQSFIGGHLRNTPDNMIQWIMHPQEVSPGVDMPDSGVPESVARDMAAYLYSLH